MISRFRMQANAEAEVVSLIELGKGKKINH